MRWHFSQGANSRVCISRFKRQGPGVDVNCATDDADSPAASETQQRPTHFLTSHQQQAEEVDVSGDTLALLFLDGASASVLFVCGKGLQLNPSVGVTLVCFTTYTTFIPYLSPMKCEHVD